MVRRGSPLPGVGHPVLASFALYLAAIGDGAGMDRGKRLAECKNSDVWRGVAGRDKHAVAAHFAFEPMFFEFPGWPRSRALDLSSNDPAPLNQADDQHSLRKYQQDVNEATERVPGHQP